MISLRPDARAASAFFKRYPSTNGPFQTERAIVLLAPAHLPLWRLRIISRCVRLLARVLAPLVGLPQGVTGCRPPEVRPSPPPCGWSTGFITTPRLCGRRPSQRDRPALPIFWFMLSGLDTAPTEAMNSARTMGSSPDIGLIWA